MAEEPEVVVPDVEPAIEPEVEPAVEPHPLAEGGARFNEVYARMKAAEDRAARMEGALSQLQRPVPQPQIQLTSENVAAHLQTQVDRGEITPMQAANVLSQFNAQRAANQTAIQVEQQRAFNTQMQEAANEVDQYILKVPALRDTSSPEFQKVSAAAHRVSRRMGLPVTDFRVQQTALEGVYGGLDKIAAVGNARQRSRESSLPHTESGVGSTGRAVVTGDDALKGVSQKYIDFWNKKGYTRERMVEEAKYITREPRSVPARQR